MPSVFTIHNLSYQGLFAADWVPRLDLPWTCYSSDRLEHWGEMSFLKGGIVDADVITTVSRTYAAEIQTPEQGFGLEGVIRKRASDLVGILNGIDTAEWNPATDQYLPAPYSAEDLTGKRVAKSGLLARYRLPVDDAAMARPVIGMVSRMVDQKGFDLVAGAASELPHLGATFVVLGTGAARYEDLWRGLAATYPDRIGVYIGFDESLAHLIEGGADIFLMPSRFEPCGLNQMYSLRYGTVPVVRRVGGLADTVFDCQAGPAAAGGGRRSGSGRQFRDSVGTGFLFDEYTSKALLDTLRRALSIFDDPIAWRALQAAGMEEDHSWDRSAREYVKIYDRLVGRPTAAGGAGEPGSSGVQAPSRD
jgi:starch synthase